jgi:DNA replication protein DnaC
MNKTWQEKFLRFKTDLPELVHAANEVEHFCHAWVTGDRNQSTLVLHGQPGSGKTHLLKAVERFARGAATLAHQKRSAASSEWLNKIPSVRYMFWPTIAGELAQRRSWPVEEATAADLLLWDDLGAESDPWKNMADSACQILSGRERKWTVITTNIQPGEWATRFDDRIADRLVRNSVVVDLSGVESYATR